MHVNPVFAVFAVLFGIGAFQEARRFQREYGATPWSWDPLVWAVVLFLFWPIGLVLLAIAERQGRTASTQGLMPAVTGYGQAPAAMGMAPVTSAVAGGSVLTAEPGTIVAPAAPAAPAQGFWAADPGGRHQYRWWDGERWTASVATNGVVSVDPG